MDLLPDLSINASIEELVAQDTEIDDTLEEPTVKTITKDNSNVEVESVDNMFVGLKKEEDNIVEDNNIEGDFVDKKVEDLPKPKTTKRGRPKKPATEKQKEHLKRIRAKALETRRKNSELKKQAVLETEKKIKENKKKKKVEIVESPIEPQLTPNIPTTSNKITEMESNSFQSFLNNMNKFMVLQENHEKKQIENQNKINKIREKQKLEKERKLKEQQEKQKPKIQPQPQRQFIPGINAPIVQQKNPYDDYFG